ncbi:TerB family tellurite resistance protein [Aestuariirhabdus litorea]|uniref:TerB family tellurite resistance protein n=1 Tax=Aestuariirhabdus litorea TaxID=2528527 RepID=A0A3P3VQ30_9GAMM|nr:TerB family tellurite resistance protein [Aestuariirhabdus litorea]RRJ84835.1 TerB family tellurite resistance protein [Aestuariirhabdus litorea]RWW98060.1 TerB family tellurite resistance protein [Endozoicomonadaceae bacterium GTF-13]
MLQSLKQFFEQLQEAPQAAEYKHNLELACAVLLMEISKADAETSSEELEQIRSIVNRLGVTTEEIDSLLAMAQAQSAEVTSLHPFVKLVNDQLEYSQKVALVRSMWQVAYTDDQLDKYEEYQIRKLADLLYVAHSDFIRTKIEVLEARQP